MNLLELAGRHHSYKKAGSYGGGEYQGPCPKCGGTDRFHIWPTQGEYGTWWCRSCDQGGDAIEYLKVIDGMSFKDACKELGRELPEEEEFKRPKFKRPGTAADTFQPRITTVPAELWIQHAEKLIDWAHQQLLNNPDQLAWCAARGLDAAAVSGYRLGWNPGEKGKDLYRPRESWGLPTELKENGKAKKLWIPQGLVIPCYQAGALHRIRIRRPEGEPRYYLIPGSGTAPMTLAADRKAFVIVESELDALLINYLAGDLVGVISQGNSTAKPDANSDASLQRSMAILVALDSDPAGMQAAVWWKKQYPQAERWPVPVGKDPGEAHKQGVDIRQWIIAGLPPILTLPKPAKPAIIAPPAPAPTPSQDHDSAGPAASASPAPAAAPVSQTITSKDGREITITDDADEYARLVAAGKVVFDSREIAYVRATGADQDAAARFIDVKEIFPGAKITAGEGLQP